MEMLDKNSSLELRKVEFSLFPSGSFYLTGDMTNLYLFKLSWNNHLLNYFPLVCRYEINANILHLTFSRADF